MVDGVVVFFLAFISFHFSTFFHFLLSLLFISFSPVSFQFILILVEVKI